MAFPAIVGSPVVTPGTTATATPAVSLPPGAVGNGLLMLIRVAVGGTIAFPGWTSLANGSPDTSDDQIAILSRDADGTEGATVTGSSGNGRFAAIVWEISGNLPFSTQPPQLSTVAVGTGLAPDPTTVTPTGGAKDYLFGVLVGIEGEQGFTAGYPTAYTLGRQQTNSGAAGTDATNVRIAGAWRQANAASDDPAGITFTGTSDSWTAYAVAIHPAPTVTPIAGSDSLTLQGAETIALLAGAVATETLSLSVTLGESASATAVGGPPTVRTRLTPMGIPGRRPTLAEVVLEPVAASDSLSLSLSETASIAVSVPAVETAQLSLAAEVAAPALSSPVLDTLTLAATDASSVARSSTVTDTLSLHVDELSTAPEPIAASDSLALSVSETALMVNQTERPVTRLMPMGIPGRRRVVGVSPVDVSDSPSLSVTDAVSTLQVLIAVADTLTPSIVETLTSALSSAVLDSPTLSLTETVISQALTSAAVDLDVLHLEEQTAALLSSTLLDTAALQVSESALASVSLTVADTLSLTLPDSSSLADVSFVGAAATEAASLSLNEAISVLVQSAPSDTLSLSVSDATTSALQSPVLETASLQVSEATVIANTSSVVDSAALQIAEQVTSLKSSAVADSATIQLTETGVLGPIISEASSLTILEVSDVIVGLLSTVDPTDTATLSLTEAASVLIQIAQAVSDTVALDAEDLSSTAVSGLLPIPVEDAAPLGLTDTATSFLTSERLETLTLQLAELATRLIVQDVPASDPLSLGITEAAVVTELLPITEPFLKIPVPGRDLSMTSILTTTLVDVPARDLSIASVAFEGVVDVPARGLSVVSLIASVEVPVPARDLSIESPALASSVVIPARDLSVTSVVSVVSVDVPARDLSVESVPVNWLVDVLARELSVTSALEIFEIGVVARDLSITSLVPS